MYTHCVIGSGPAGVACATALLAHGARVLMLDAGMELEPDRATIVRELSQKKVSEWPAEQAARIHGKRGAELKDLPHKNVFGSDFPYRDTREKIPWRGDGALLPSLALGGLSNVWGSAMLPLRESDILDWPIKRSDLDEHYRAATQIMGLVRAAATTWKNSFPSIYGKSRRAENPADRLSWSCGISNAGAMLTARAAGCSGQSRMAIRAADSPRGPGCVYCGHCMTGCVYGCIYNSADTVRELLANKNFHYEGNIIVTKVRESSGAVSIEGFHRTSGQALSFGTGRVYLASGVIPTAQILLRSQNAFDQPLKLRGTSQYFLFPIILARRVRDVQSRGTPNVEPGVSWN